MGAFTEEQIRILQAAFDHVWARISRLHGDLNEGSARLAALGLVAGRKGLLGPQEWEETIGEITIEAAVKVARGRGLTEEEITRRILGGDLEAFEQAPEDE